MNSIQFQKHTLKGIIRTAQKVVSYLSANGNEASTFTEPLVPTKLVGDFTDYLIENNVYAFGLNIGNNVWITKDAKCEDDIVLCEVKRLIVNTDRSLSYDLKDCNSEQVYSIPQSELGNTAFFTFEEAKKSLTSPYSSYKKMSCSSYYTNGF